MTLRLKAEVCQTVPPTKNLKIYPCFFASRLQEKSTQTLFQIVTLNIIVVFLISVFSPSTKEIQTFRILRRIAYHLAPITSDISLSRAFSTVVLHPNNSPDIHLVGFLTGTCGITRIPLVLCFLHMEIHTCEIILCFLWTFTLSFSLSRNVILLSHTRSQVYLSNLHWKMIVKNTHGINISNFILIINEIKETNTDNK